MDSLGTVQVSVSKQLWTLRCAGVASQGGGGEQTLKMLSAVGPQTTIKAFTAALHSSEKTVVSLHVMRCGEYNATHSTMKLSRDTAGYEIRRSRLGLDSWHMLALSEDTRLLPVLCQRSVEAKLRSSMFTTPFCAEWIAYLCRKLSVHKLLSRLNCFQAECGMLTATDKNLDDIVTEGLRTGDITIPEARSNESH